MNEITRRDALIAACRANKEDDLPRLVFADYLDETGSEKDAARAFTIRDQCEKRDLRRVPGAYAAYDGVSVGQLAFVLSTWDRGFIVAAESTDEWWLQHGDDLVREHDVQRVRLTTLPRLEVAGRRLPTTATFADLPADERFGVPVVESEFDDGFVATDVTTERLLRAHWPSVSEWSLPPIREVIENETRRRAYEELLGRMRSTATQGPLIREPRTFITGPA